MSYQGPMSSKEPELRWPAVLVAAVVTTFIVLVPRSGRTRGLGEAEARAASPRKRHVWR